MIRAIGKTFKDGDNTLRVVKAKSLFCCIGCFYFKNNCAEHSKIRGFCDKITRPDEIAVIFEIQEDVK